MELIFSKSALLLLILISCLIAVVNTQAEEIAVAKEIYEGAKTGVQIAKKVNELYSNACFNDDQCFDGTEKNILTINNFCCSFQCCNMVTYIFRNEKWGQNMADVFNKPRPMNILVFVLLVLSTLCSCCIITCCCSRKSKTNIIVSPFSKDPAFMKLLKYKPLKNSDV